MFKKDKYKEIKELNNKVISKVNKEDISVGTIGKVTYKDGDIEITSSTGKILMYLYKGQERLIDWMFFKFYYVQNFELEREVTRRVVFRKKKVVEDYVCSLDLKGIDIETIKMIYQKLLIYILILREHDKEKLITYSKQIDFIVKSIHEYKLSNDIDGLRKFCNQTFIGGIKGECKKIFEQHNE